MAEPRNQVNSSPEAILEQYANATGTKVITSQKDIDTKDKVLDEMLAWCKEQKTLVVLKSATILASEPTSRTVQNCKSLMLSKGIHPGQVYAATLSLVGLMLASGQEEDYAKRQKG